MLYTYVQSEERERDFETWKFIEFSWGEEGVVGRGELWETAKNFVLCSPINKGEVVVHVQEEEDFGAPSGNNPTPPYSELLFFFPPS